MKMKAQGSLEYLIIVAAILAIAAIVTLFLTGAFGSGKTTGDVALCKSAASKCALERATSEEATCSFCNEACSSMPIKINTCKEGNPDDIYAG